MKDCTAKHTKYQPEEGEWACPYCGTSPANEKNAAGQYVEFFIQQPADCAHPDCAQLHDTDMLGCSNCERGLTGKAFAARLARAKNLIPCTCCRGTGFVTSESKTKPTKTKARK